MMKIEEIRMQVDQVFHIAHERGDNEEAHAYEDALLEDFVRYVAAQGNHDPDIRQKAQEVARVFEIEYERWYA